LLAAANDVKVGPGGELYIVDTNNHRVRMVRPGPNGVVDGGEGETIITVAGGGTSEPPLADGGRATGARLCSPRSVALDGAGRLFIPESAEPPACLGDRIRRVVPGADGVVNGGDDEVIDTVAGRGTTRSELSGVPLPATVSMTSSMARRVTAVRRKRRSCPTRAAWPLGPPAQSSTSPTLATGASAG
jgi:hypothetical protein